MEALWLSWARGGGGPRESLWSGNYYVWGRFASDRFPSGPSPFEVLLAKVSGAATANQTLTPWGGFKCGGHHAQEFSYEPLTDAQGQLVSVSLSGVETLRMTFATWDQHLTLPPEVNANYFMLVPARPAPPVLTIARSAGAIAVSWTGTGFTLEATDRLGSSWTPVTNPSNPFNVTPSGSARFYRLR